MDSKTAVKQFLALKKIDPTPMRLAGESWGAEWKTLISILLSARTRDEITIPVAEGLFKAYPSLQKLSKASLKDLERVLKSINFYKTKAKRVYEFSRALMNDYNGKVPHDFDELIKLPGVGRKTANVFLAEIGDDTVGVDTHLHQISNKLGWSDAKNPHKVEEDLKALFPKKYWRDLNPVTVRFGKTHTKRSEWNRLLDEVKATR